MQATSAAAAATLINQQTAQAQRRGQNRPNIILIMTDDQGYGDLGITGNPYIKTPNIDAFSKESVEVEHFYVMPVCSPTRACLLTGRYYYRTGVVDTFLGRSMMHSDEITLAEMLKEAGYRTGIFGKWHLGDNYPMRAMDNGFDESLVHNGGGIAQPSDPPGQTYFDPILKHNGEQKRFRGYCTDIFTDAAIEFMKDANRREPFFLYLPTNAPHTPLQIADEYVKPYLDMGLDETTAKLYGMVTNIDDNVGKLLTWLERINKVDNTIVIFITDNGAQQNRYNAGLRGTKGTVYEGGIRVPCYIRYPREFKAKHKVTSPAAHIDIVPTILDLCGLEPPKDRKIDGKSILPQLTGEESSMEERSLFLQWHRGDVPEPFRNSAVRAPRYKLVDGKELYDIKEDPRELHDIASDHPDIVQDLRKQYEEWFADVSSTRGYDPPRIFIGTEHENPVTLTIQDWRGENAGWGKDSLGHWEVYVANDDEYNIILHTLPAEDDGTIDFKLGETWLSKPIGKATTQHTFKNVKLPKGDARLEAWMTINDKKSGARYVDVKKIS
jgi:arylsulfatase A-like enzyme